ncbi:hypothetical protein [Litorisediminicola beolgyonensis]|uniref:DNA alkylation repair enzyme n=1 Tax=Litorisediminicola beolgyonensis TaxID=1173614 RepID=A0ABW3ZMW4_9RHOB
MARGPDGAGGGTGVSLADQLFNPDSIGDLAREYSVLPGFDPDRFLGEVLPGLPGTPLLARLDLIADALERQLPRAFPAMAEVLEAAMPPELDPSLKDNDFGRFIHAVPGVLAVRHGLEDHRERALDLLHRATRRFSMEFYIRPFLNRWPDETFARLERWVEDDKYHVRRLVSEGTRPRLPWAANIRTDPERPLPLLDRLHADDTRYVTRSVANHLNDISKIVPGAVTSRLVQWAAEDRQTSKELGWITRHALRTAVKRGEPEALRLVGCDPDVAVAADLTVAAPSVRIGAALEFEVVLTAEAPVTAMVDYRIAFHRPSGRVAEKVFKIKTLKLEAKMDERVSARHLLKRNASTFTWHPGPHRLILQVNGIDRAEARFGVTD